MKREGRYGNAGSDEKEGQAPPSHDSPIHTSHHSQYSPPSHPSGTALPTPSAIPPRGNYHTLLSFQKAEVVYDLTFRFAHKFLAKGDRTIDQMIQAARSGKKNILEGSKAGRTSKETEIKLTNVARASLEELLDDYLDFLRARDLPIWGKESPEALYVRELGRKPGLNFEDIRQFVETRPAATVANIAICLIHQTNYLLDQQLRHLDREFVEQGGLRERLTRTRLQFRKNQNQG